jgi:proteasome lid subunit RPN8/RPN11
MMQIRQGVLERAFEHLRQCGRGRAECVAYLTGPVDTPTLVDDVVHPVHTASVAGYDLDSSAIAELWRDLTASRRSIRIQVHTHPGAAYHSSRDDSLALVHTPWFLSLVIPNFALGDVGFDGAFLAELNHQGRWVGVAIDNRLEVTP